MKCTICRGTEDVKFNPDVSQFVDRRVYLCDGCRRSHSEEESRAEIAAEEMRGDMISAWFHRLSRKTR